MTLREKIEAADYDQLINDLLTSVMDGLERRLAAEARMDALRPA